MSGNSNALPNLAVIVPTIVVSFALGFLSASYFNSSSKSKSKNANDEEKSSNEQKKTITAGALTPKINLSDYITLGPTDISHAAAEAPLQGIKIDDKTTVVTELNIYPIKSCARIKVQEAVITDLGLEYDRNWLIIKERNNRFITQREYPQMAFLVPSILIPKASSGSGATAAAPPTILKLTSLSKDPSMKGKEIYVPIVSSETPNNRVAKVKVWNDFIDDVVDQGDEVANFINDHMKAENDEKFRLVYFAPKSIRPVDERFALNPGKDVVGFADAYPALLTSTSSLDDLNKRIEAKSHSPITMRRFRPNIVVSGGTFTKPWIEDELMKKQSVLKVENSDIQFRLVKPCDRCKLTTIDPETAEYDLVNNEPIATLRDFRKLPDFDGEKSQNVYFGQNAIFLPETRAKKCVIRVGDKVIVS